MEKKEELKDCKFIEELIPNITEDDQDIIEAMINGFQGRDIDDKPVFKDLDHLKVIVMEAGAYGWLENYLK